MRAQIPLQLVFDTDDRIHALHFLSFGVSYSGVVHWIGLVNANRGDGLDCLGAIPIVAGAMGG